MKYLKLIITGMILGIFVGNAPILESSPSLEYIMGTASWYAEFSPGIRETTANMEQFDHNKMTCAIWNLPFNSILEVTNLANNRKIIVRVNDRGPAKRFCRQGRVIDLTLRAFQAIEAPDKGLTNVRIRVLR